MKRKIPKHCKGCKLLWTLGITEGGHNMWCCKYGQPSYNIVGHCILKDGKEI